MQPLHERFLHAAATERAASRTTRRRALAGGAKVVVSGAFALAFGTGLGKALAQDAGFEDDVEVLNYALTLEHLEFAFYRDGLDKLGEEAFADIDGDIFARLEEIRDHEQAHVDALTQTILDLGGEPVAEAQYDFGYQDVTGFLDVAQALESTGVAAYAGAIPAIANPAVLAAALGIHSVEARHAAYLNERNAVSPFPDAFDEALGREDVRDAADGFIVGEGNATPAGTTGEDRGAPVAADIKGFQFDPDELEVAAGTTVTWTNRERVPHTVTAEDGSFDSGSLSDGDRFSFTFDTPGTFPYFCAYHTSMTGTITVT